MRLSCPNPIRDRQAFTLMEVLVLVVTIVVLAFVAVPRMVSRRASSGRIQCVNALKNIGLSFRIFATDNAGAYPAQVSTNKGGSLEWLAGGAVSRQWVVLSNELSTPKLLVCNKDLQRSVAPDWARVGRRHLSYFLNVAAVPEHGDSVLAGDRNLVVDGRVVSPGRRRLIAAHRIAWGSGIHGHAGNLLLADGGVHQLTSPGVDLDFRASSAAGTNDLLIP